MKTRIGTAATLLVLAGCGGGTGANNSGATAAAPAPAPIDNRLEDVPPRPHAAPDLEGARVLIGRIYLPYTRGQAPDLAAVYTPELQRAIDRQDDGDGAGLGFDPFCRCQDFENFRYTIARVERLPGDGAVAQIDLVNMGERHSVLVSLSYRNDRWLVADVREGRQSLLAAGR